MAILVTCPGCMSRFSVDDKFAGKSGPCPKCKKTITIPTKAEEVVIHAPEASGPKDSTGKLVLKPIKRREFRVSGRSMVAWGLGTLAAMGLALAMRWGVTLPWPAWLAIAFALAIPLVMAGYEFLRDDELAGYTGRELWQRTLICAVAFAATWGMYGFLSWYFENKSLADSSVLQMAIYVAAMVALGTAVSVGAFELEMGQSMLHYLFYLVITFLLAWIAGLPISEAFPGKKPSSAPAPVAPIEHPAASGEGANGDGAAMAPAAAGNGP